MATIAQLRAGLAARLRTIDGLRVYEKIPDTVNPTAAVIVPDAGVYGLTFGRNVDSHSFTIQIVISRSNEAGGQDRLDEFISGSGAKAIIAAVDGDDTLGGVAHYTVVKGWREYGEYNLGGVDYLGCVFDVEIVTDA